MGTRSVLAIPQGDGWKGRYCHWDGYPSWNGLRLLDLVARDGVEQVRKVLTEDHYGWSNLDLTVDADTELGAGMDDGRFAIVSGYGRAYTTEQGQSDPEEWITHDGDDWGTEWAYVLGDTHLTVLERSYANDRWEYRGQVEWGDPLARHLLTDFESGVSA